MKGILNDFDALRLALKMGSKFLQANADTFSLTSEICQGPRFFFPDSSSWKGYFPSKASVWF